MVVKMPRITVDPSALRHGVWGNSWRQWGLIMGAFLALYSVLAGLQTGMLFAALGIRGDSYRTMSGKYFGAFERQLFTATLQPLPSTGRSKDPHYFNRPNGCAAQQRTEALPGFPDLEVDKPTGVLECSNANKQWRWTVYPWVLDTNGLGKFPGCANAQGSKGSGSSYLSQASSPAGAGAGAGDINATTAQAWVCQNGVPL